MSEDQIDFSAIHRARRLLSFAPMEEIDNLNAMLKKKMGRSDSQDPGKSQAEDLNCDTGEGELKSPSSYASGSPVVLQKDHQKKSPKEALLPDLNSLNQSMNERITNLKTAKVKYPKLKRKPPPPTDATTEENGTNKSRKSLAPLKDKNNPAHSRARGRSPAVGQRQHQPSTDTQGEGEVDQEGHHRSRASSFSGSDLSSVSGQGSGRIRRRGSVGRLSSSHSPSRGWKMALDRVKNRLSEERAKAERMLKEESEVKQAKGEDSRQRAVAERRLAVARIKALKEHEEARRHEIESAERRRNEQEVKAAARSEAAMLEARGRLRQKARRVREESLALRQSVQKQEEERRVEDSRKADELVERTRLRLLLRHSHDKEQQKMKEMEEARLHEEKRERERKNIERAVQAQRAAAERLRARRHRRDPLHHSEPGPGLNQKAAQQGGDTRLNHSCGDITPVVVPDDEHVTPVRRTCATGPEQSAVVPSRPPPSTHSHATGKPTEAADDEEEEESLSADQPWKLKTAVRTRREESRRKAIEAMRGTGSTASHEADGVGGKAEEEGNDQGSDAFTLGVSTSVVWGVRDVDPSPASAAKAESSTQNETEGKGGGGRGTGREKEISTKSDFHRKREARAAAVRSRQKRALSEQGKKRSEDQRQRAREELDLQERALFGCSLDQALRRQKLQHQQASSDEDTSPNPNIIQNAAAAESQEGGEEVKEDGEGSDPEKILVNFLRGDQQQSEADVLKRAAALRKTLEGEGEEEEYDDNTPHVVVQNSSSGTGNSPQTFLPQVHRKPAAAAASSHPASKKLSRKTSGVGGEGENWGPEKGLESFGGRGQTHEAKLNAFATHSSSTVPSLPSISESAPASVPISNPNARSSVGKDKKAPKTKKSVSRTDGQSGTHPSSSVGSEAGKTSQSFPIATITGHSFGTASSASAATQPAGGLGGSRRDKEAGGKGAGDKTSKRVPVKPIHLRNDDYYLKMVAGSQAIHLAKTGATQV